MEVILLTICKVSNTLICVTHSHTLLIKTKLLLPGEESSHRAFPVMNVGVGVCACDNAFIICA